MLYIEFARRQLSLTQAQLSKATRIRQPFISQIERGEGLPTAAQLQRLSVVLSVPPDLLLKTVNLRGCFDEDDVEKMEAS